MAEPTIPRPPWIETPLLESANLSKAAGCRIFLKTENVQPSGSFKSRGPGNVVYQHVLQDRKSKSGKQLHFYCSSGGNAGMGCVTAAASLGYPSSVVVPITTKPGVIAQLKAAGATEVVQTGESWFYADQYLRESIIPSARETGVIEPIYVSPFDDPLITSGYTHIVSEIRRQLLQYADPDDPTPDIPDAIICTVGGGGLFTGLQEGLRLQEPLSSSPDHSTTTTATTTIANPWPQVPLLAVGTTGASALATSLRSGHIITLPSITSIATSLGAVRISEAAWRAAQYRNVKTIVLSDADAAMGVYRFADDHRVLVEPACGVGLAVCYKRGLLRGVLMQGEEDGDAGMGNSRFGKEKKVVVVVCGGSGATVSMVEEFKAKYGKEWAEDGAEGGGQGQAEGKGITRSEEVKSSWTLPGGGLSQDQDEKKDGVSGVE